jgi:hypothetical protein
MRKQQLRVWHLLGLVASIALCLWPLTEIRESFRTIKSLHEREARRTFDDHESHQSLGHSLDRRIWRERVRRWHSNLARKYDEAMPTLWYSFSPDSDPPGFESGVLERLRSSTLELREKLALEGVHKQQNKMQSENPADQLGENK